MIVYFNYVGLGKKLETDLFSEEVLVGIVKGIVYSLTICSEYYYFGGIIIFPFFLLWCSSSSASSKIEFFYIYVVFFPFFPILIIRLFNLC